MSAIETIRRVADDYDWRVVEDNTAYMVIEFRKSGRYVRVRYDTRGTVIGASADNRFLPDRNTKTAVIEKLIA